MKTLTLLLFLVGLCFAGECDECERRLVQKEAEVEVLVDFYKSHEETIASHGTERVVRSLVEAATGLLLALSAFYGGKRVQRRNGG